MVQIYFLGATDFGEVGTHVLQFFWSSAFYNFSYPLAYFVTTQASTENIQYHFWCGVYELKKRGLSVVATIFDGAASNRRFQVGLEIQFISFQHTLHTEISASITFRFS